MKVDFLSTLFIVFILIISQSLGFSSVFAQIETKPNDNLYWINGGLGRSSLGSLGGSAGISIQLKKMMFSLRATGNSEKGGWFEGGDEFSDVGLLIGIATQRPKNHASFSVGLARVTGSRYIETETKGFSLFSGKRVDISPTIGFPIESQLFLKLSSWFGMGLNIYFNINEKRTFGGITLNLMLGKLR